MKRADEALPKRDISHKYKNHASIYSSSSSRSKPVWLFSSMQHEMTNYEDFTQVFCIQYIVPTSDTFATKYKMAQ